MDPIDDGCQRLTGRSNPGVSPGSSIPVREPKPKRVMNSCMVASPTRNPSLIAATLLDLASASAIVNVPKAL